MKRLLLPVLVALLVLPGCGEEERPRPVVELPPPPAPDPVPHAERVQYALERLERGPRPLGPLRVPDIHRRNLELAEDDLIALEAEAQKQLAEPERIRRITEMARRNADPWHNVLRVLLGMERRPVELVLAWTRPVLDAPPENLTLRLEATRLLSTISDERAAPVLLTLLRRHPAHRELAAVAFSSLVLHGGAARDEALAIALRHGAPSLWSDAWQRLAGLVPAGEADVAVADALAWWSGLIAGSGPRLPTALPHLKDHPWSQARLAVADGVPGRADGKPGGLVYGPLSSGITHGSGAFAADFGDAPVMPPYAFLFTGKLPAAEGRCVLARWSHAPYSAAVEADLLQEDVDPNLAMVAKHCMLGPMSQDESSARRDIAWELDQGAPWDTQRVIRVQGLVSILSAVDEEETWDLLERVLLDMHPLTVCRPAIEQAYDVMKARMADLVRLVSAALDGDDEARRGVALHLIRRARDPLYLDVLEHRLDTGADDAEAHAIRRTLVFIYSRGYGVEPARLEAFVGRYVGWLDPAKPESFAGLASGLLDLGESGEAAFAAGLRGPQRDLFLAAWPRDRRLVPRAVADAAVAPLGTDSRPGEVAAVLSRAYYSFPAASVDVLAALRRRLLPAVRPLLEPVMERVAHRAPFRRRKM